MCSTIKVNPDVLKEVNVCPWSEGHSTLLIIQTKFLQTKLFIIHTVKTGNLGGTLVSSVIN